MSRQEKKFHNSKIASRASTLRKAGMGFEQILNTLRHLKVRDHAGKVIDRNTLNGILSYHCKDWWPLPKVAQYKEHAVGRDGPILPKLTIATPADIALAKIQAGDDRRVDVKTGWTGGLACPDPRGTARVVAEDLTSHPGCIMTPRCEAPASHGRPAPLPASGPGMASPSDPRGGVLMVFLLALILTAFGVGACIFYFPPN